MRDITCPYCGTEQDICHDDGFGYSEDELHVMECASCDRGIGFTTSILFCYSDAKKVPCWDTGDHVFRPPSADQVKARFLGFDMSAEDMERHYTVNCILCDKTHALFFAKEQWCVADGEKPV